VCDEDPSHHFGGNPAIDIEKSTNGEDADEPTGPVVPVGSPVEFAYQVTNTGNVDLANISVVDDQGLSVSCPQDTLAAGDSMTCTASTMASEGQYTNLGTACGEGAGQNVCDEDPSHHFGGNPAIDIEKSTNGEDADEPTGPVVPVGSTVEFAYQVTNTGNFDLTNVTVRDDRVSAPATGSAAASIDFEGLDEGAIVAELSCGSGITCTGGDLSGTVSVRAHNPLIDNGDTNTAMIFNADCVALVNCTGGDDDLSFPGHGKTLIISADLDQADPDDQEDVGSFMEFDFSGLGPEGVTINSIDVGDIEEREIGGFVAGSASSCTGTESGSDNIPLPITGNNGIETVNFELSGVHCFLVHLNGSGTVDNIQFTTATQPVPGEVEVSCPKDTLAVGEAMTCTGSTTATPGQYTNLGTACGDGAGQNVCDEDPSNHFGEIPDDEPAIISAIDIEKWTRIVGGPAGGDICETIGKPEQLTMLYTGDNILDHTQDSGKVKVDGDAGFAAMVHIISAEKADGNGKIYFDGNVGLGESFVIDAALAGEDKLKSNTFVLIVNQDGSRLQTIEFHTSCSQPLELGDQFGAIQLISLAGRNGDSGTFDASPDSDPGFDADSPAGPEGQVGDDVNWTYFVTNTGDAPLTEVTVVDDSGTPDDPADDFGPTLVSGDDNGDNILDLAEIWLYQATGSVKLGQYANVGQVSGVGPDDITVMDQDPSHYLGVFPSGDICEGKGKPRTLTLLYTGNNILDHSQKEGKVNVSGDPQGAPVVHITSAEKADGKGKGKGKQLFERTVNLGEQFVIGETERLKSQTFVLIQDQNGDLLQSIEFHTSCSQPLERGDQFGGIQLIDSTSR
jgi:hypothetical protein